MINEQLIQFIWQYGYFNQQEMKSTAGETIIIEHKGTLNREQGPDFSYASIQIGNTRWAGTVEVHVKTSHWLRHGHQQDCHYKNVILHVVWEHDKPVNDIPVLELSNRTSGLLLERYKQLCENQGFIPCERLIQNVPPLIWTGWRQRLIAERLMEKSKQVAILLAENNFHWEETFWWMLSKNMGMRVNADAFEAIARSIPLTIIARHKKQIHQLEALLLGQGGLLEERFTDKYALLLQREYAFLKHKYQLKRVHIPVFFLRMRPVNFPTIRLAQLAVFLQQSTHLFSKIKLINSVQEMKQLLNAGTNDYWLEHYQLGKPAVRKEKRIGLSMQHSIIINTIAPLLFAYGEHMEQHSFKEKAVNWLEELPGEDNETIRAFAGIGIKSSSAATSQALLQMKKYYCKPVNCLKCAVGANVLQQTTK